MRAPVGVLVMAYGTPAGTEDIEAYYTHVRRGRAPTPELLADLVDRYAAIGGTSPLAERSAAQAKGIQAALDRTDPGRFEVRLGYKHAPPFIEDTVAALAADGIARLVGLVLAPHWSSASIGQYLARADRADVALAGIESWHLEPAYLDFLAERVTDARRDLTPAAKVVFTAHSLPQRALEGDPYATQVRQTAEAVAARAGLDPWTGWALAWQSAGRTPDPWLGPDVRDVIRALGAAGDGGGMLVCPCGFVSDHLEVLYDLDIEAAALAAEAGVAFARTSVPDDDPAVMEALAARVRAAARADLGT